MKRAVQRMQYLWKTGGTSRLLRQVASQLASPVYKFELLYVVVSHSLYAVEDEESGPGAVGRAFATSLAEFQALKPYLHRDVDVAYIESFLAERETRFVTLYRYENEDGSPTYFGWTTYDRGYFSMPEYRFRGALPDGMLGGYEVEIVPEFRGRGMGSRGRGAMHTFQTSLGATRTVGVIRSHNVVSLNWASRTFEGAIIDMRGPIRMSRWFGSLIVRTPSWAEFLALVEAPLPASEAAADVAAAVPVRRAENLEA